MDLGTGIRKRSGVMALLSTEGEDEEGAYPMALSYRNQQTHHVAAVGSFGPTTYTQRLHLGKLTGFRTYFDKKIPNNDYVFPNDPDIVFDIHFLGKLLRTI